MSRVSGGHWPASHFTPSAFSAGMFGAEDTVAPGAPVSVGSDATINLVRLSAFGGTLSSISDWLSTASESWTESSVFGDAGFEPISEHEGGRPFDLGILLEGSSAADLRLKRDQAISVLRRFRPARIILDDDQTRQVLAYLSRAQWRPTGPDYIAAAGLLLCSFVAADPFLVDVTEQSIEGVTTMTACPIGTGQTWPRWRIKGSCSNPQAIVRGSDGSIVATFGFSGSLSASEFYTVENEPRRQTIYKNTTGEFGGPLGSEAYAEWTSGNFFALEHEHGSFWLGENPTIEVTAASGTPVLDIYYSRTWR